MGGRGSGRRPKPRRAKELAGNPGKRRLPAEPEIPASYPNPPKWLGRIAIQEWRRLQKHLEPHGYITQIDLGVLAGFCTIYETIVHAEEDLQEHGQQVILHAENHEGNLYVRDVKKNPAIDIKIKAIQQLRALAGEFGATPAMRSKVHIPTSDETAPPQGAAKYLNAI